MPLLTAGALIAGVLIVGVVAIANGGPGGASAPPVVAADVPPPPVELRDGRSLGDPEAPVLVEIFEDPQCPACGTFTARIEPLLRAGPVTRGEVLLTYRDMVFIGPPSVEAAASMRVADDLGDAFWPFHDVLYANQHSEYEGAYSRDRLADMAEIVGIDRDAFLAALDDPTYQEAVLAETAEARALGVGSTPTLRIDGRLLVGVPAWPELEAIIDAALVARPADAPGGVEASD